MGVPAKRQKSLDSAGRWTYTAIRQQTGRRSGHSYR